MADLKGQRLAAIVLTCFGLACFAGSPEARGSYSDATENRARVFGGGGQYQTVVEFRVKRRHGVPRSAIFAATIRPFCDDGTQTTVELDPIKVPFISRTTFEGAEYSVSATGSKIYYRVLGILSSKNRARGFVIFFANAPETGTSMVPDCSTTGLNFTWQAKK